MARKRVAKPAAGSAPKRGAASKRAPVKKRAAKVASKKSVGTKRVAKTATKKDAVAKRENQARPKAATGAELNARKAVIATALEMSKSGLSPGRSGNVSVRWDEGMLITPSGMSYDVIKPSDIVYVDGDGNVGARSKKPSSEWRFHLSAYHARPDRAAIVHTHSLHAVVLACAHKSIPAFHYMVAVAGGDRIPLVPYAPFGTQELAEYVAEGVAKVDACLMANHGQIALGGTLAQALELAGEVEILSEQYLKVLTLGMPMLLGRREMADVLERFSAYGQNAQGAGARQGK